MVSLVVTEQYSNSTLSKKRINLLEKQINWEVEIFGNRFDSQAQSEIVVVELAV